ncbi:NADPH:quinone reductase-like Zn-dependent oxidoreductase [Streptomyces umbrinus]|uniref:NADPH:quinone reductase-like Zn-dependent oxidoreductase n=1 Tax=Streptomyces umbrinus TaxID=67370 RepID=A0ABU0TBW3_9ACTN|nr:NADP-dependent oxidoreductase [Streptomyces umbrinus]MDQ1033132.1 NADPH:quinone reductase-like Zn-dependent oxidoreductase [Streptomyces umbrinus]
MRAIVFNQFGGPEVLHETSVDLPVPGPGQVRVRVAAAGVNALDGKIRSGVLEQVFPTALPAVPGRELSGTVDALGEGVTTVAVGDEVLGWADTGSYAEFALSSQFAVKPSGLSFEQAAALPVAVEAAERVLRLLDVKKDETLLVHGAAGAVGTIAVQFTVSRGARVIGTAGADNQAYLTSLGATPTVYGEGLVDRVRALAPDGVDAVLDLAGQGALPDSVELRGSADRIVTTADFRAQQFGVVFAAPPEERSAERLAEAARHAAEGTLTTTVGRVYPLASAPQAQRDSDSGHARGKLVVTVG